MAKPNNRKCICCSTEYRYCNTCAEDKTKPAWYAIYCSENCKKLFQAVSGYLANAVSFEETKRRFDDCDLSYKNKLKDSFIKVIDEIYKNEVEELENMEMVNVEELIEETIDISDKKNSEKDSIKIMPRTRNGKMNKRK